MGQKKGEGYFTVNPDAARAAGKKGGDTVRKKYGHDYFQEIGKKGGDTVLRRHGKEYFSKIGRKGGVKKAQKRRMSED